MAIPFLHRSVVKGLLSDDCFTSNSLPENGDSTLTMESHIDPLDRVINKRYRVLKLLGRGAFGSAYLAEDVRAFGKVVVKLTNQIESDEEWQAFAREAETLARVNDPHIVQLRDFGKTEEGVGYIVRQYVEGSTLNELIQHQKPLGIEFSIRWPRFRKTTTSPKVCWTTAACGPSSSTL